MLRKQYILDLKKYRSSLHNTYIYYGRIGSILGLIVIPIFYLKDIYLIYYPGSTLIARAIPMIISILYLITSATRLKYSKKYIRRLYLLLCSSYYFMLILIFYSNFGLGNEEQDFQLINSIILIVFLVYVFSPGLKRYLRNIFLLPFIILVGVLQYKLNLSLSKIGEFFNPMLIEVALLIIGRISENKEVKSYLTTLELNKSQNLLTKEISERLKYEERLKDLAYLDTMTGAYNRNAADKHILKKLEIFKEKKIPFYLIYLDIDGLKITNDKQGHEKGDELIIKFSNLIQSNIRGRDSLYRMGGDEFILILQMVNKSDFDLFCSRLHRECQNANIQYSSGYVDHNVLKNNSPEECIKIADSNMYYNKNYNT